VGWKWGASEKKTSPSRDSIQIPPFWDRGGSIVSYSELVKIIFLEAKLFGGTRGNLIGSGGDRFPMGNPRGGCKLQIMESFSAIFYPTGMGLEGPKKKSSQEGDSKKEYFGIGSGASKTNSKNPSRCSKNTGGGHFSVRGPAEGKYPTKGGYSLKEKGAPKREGNILRGAFNRPTGNPGGRGMLIPRFQLARGACEKKVKNMGATPF